MRAARGLLPLLLLAACSGEPAGGVAVPGREGATKSPAVSRAARRLFDGAPPVIPHRPSGAACRSCHNQQGMAVEGLGFAPPSPHGPAAELGALARCEQCHVWQQGDGEFAANGFRGLAQDLRSGARLFDGAPPVIPHQLLMRENCTACHSGPAAREEIRCSHPERVRCRQCHVPVLAAGLFRRPAGR